MIRSSAWRRSAAAAPPAQSGRPLDRNAWLGRGAGPPVCSPSEAWGLPGPEPEECAHVIPIDLAGQELGAAPLARGCPRRIGVANREQRSVDK